MAPKMRPKLYKRLFNAPKSHYFLFGPRGTGKSTWAMLHYANALWIDFLDPAALRLYQGRPERLREVVNAAPPDQAVIIDEVQRVPEVLSVVHALIEEKKPRQFVLTGSSARKLKRVGVDLLAGRAVMREMHPFMAVEVNHKFDLGRALEIGMLPVVLDAPDPIDALNAYVTTYLQQEVLAEGLVRNLGNFTRFLEVMSFSHGSVLNVSNVARECEIERKTVEGFLAVLQDLLLSFHLPVFSRRAKRELTRHPKFYLFDCGVYRTLRPAGPLDRTSELNGAGLEGLVAQHLRAWIAYSGSDCKLHFWRTRNGVEVDFILYGKDQFTAIEVKNATNVHPKDVRPLCSFQEDYPEARLLLLYRGQEPLIVNGVMCLPCDQFLSQLHPNRDLIPN